MSNIIHNSFSQFLVASGLLGTALLSGCGGGGGASETATTAPLASTATPTAVPVETPVGILTSSTDGDTSVKAESAEVGAPLEAATSAAISAIVMPANCPADTWGTFDRPFAANSPWNSRPVAPILGTETIPLSSFFPSIASGAYSSTAFKATASDTSVTVTGPNGTSIWDPDSEQNRPSITIAHWPAGVVPASGSDGHAEIVDTVTGVVHSFWQLKQVNGAWQAAQYAWTPLTGRGMGDPSHYFQGARAAGVSTLGGLIRKSEVKDGEVRYKHALAMSLTFNGLSANPAYTFPATSADSNAATSNTGSIPMGALMLLPASFDAQSMSSPELRKVAETLKSYGAYVVDRNYGTPFAIYVENGADFNLHPNGWSNAAAADLQTIRAALRPLKTASSWIDGNGRVADITNRDLNLLSMRGYWYRSKGTQTGVFDTWRQTLAFPATTTPIEQNNSGGRAYAGVQWATPVVGSAYRLTVNATGGARLRTTITDKNTNVVVYDSGDMSNGQTADFAWPTASFRISTFAKSGVSGVESTVNGVLVKAPGTAGAALPVRSACAR